MQIFLDIYAMFAAVLIRYRNSNLVLLVAIVLTCGLGMNLVYRRWLWVAIDAIIVITYCLSITTSRYSLRFQAWVARRA